MDLEWIRQRIAETGLKQSEIASTLGLTQVQVSKSLRGSRRFTAAETDKLREMLREPANPQHAPLPMFPVLGDVPAGNWREAIEDVTEWMPSLDPRASQRSYYLDIVGDSMDLVVPDGGRVLVDPDDRALYPDRYYVIRNAAGDVTFKQFMSNPARLVPCSSNPAHKEIMIGVEQFEIVGRVPWVGRSV